MGTSIRWTARMRALLRRWRGAPLTWLIVGGFVLMAATAIGTRLTVDRLRQNAIEHRTHRRPLPAKRDRERPRQPGKFGAAAGPPFRPRVRGFRGAAEEHHLGA